MQDPVLKQSFAILNKIDKYRLAHAQLSEEGAIEFLGQFLAETKSTFKQVKEYLADLPNNLKKLSINIQKAFKAAANFRTDQVFKDLARASVYLPNILAKAEFYKLENTKIPIIPGMKTDFITTVNELSNLFSICDQNTLPSLDRLDTVVSKFISDPTSITDSRPYTPDESVTAAVANIREKIISIIDPAGGKESALFKEVFSNISSLTTAYEQLQNIAKSITKNYLINLDKKYQVLNAKAERLIAILNKDPSNVSQAVVDQLADEFYNVGELITTTVSVHYIYTQMCMTLTFILRVFNGKVN